MARLIITVKAVIAALLLGMAVAGATALQSIASGAAAGGDCRPSLSYSCLFVIL